jgi:hypothetical protein
MRDGLGGGMGSWELDGCSVLWREECPLGRFFLNKSQCFWFQAAINFAEQPMKGMEYNEPNKNVAID